MAKTASQPVDSGLQATPQFNPTKDAVQRAALKDYERSRQPGVTVSLPNSEFVKVEAALGFKYSGEKRNDMLAMPESVLKDPKPPFGRGMPRYMWAIREDTVKHGGTPRHNLTKSWKRAEKIRYIEECEVDPKAPNAVFEILVAGDKSYVTDGSMILCEILDPELSYEKFKYWEDKSINQIMQLPRELEETSNLPVGDGMRMGHIPGKTVTETVEFAANPKTRAAEGV